MADLEARISQVLNQNQQIISFCFPKTGILKSAL